MSNFVAFISGALMAWAIAWGDAHNQVAAECERLGGFFVGSRVFTCEVKK